MSPDTTEPPVLLEPEALKAARSVYQDYQARYRHRPLVGVAVNCDTYHTTLIFSRKPVLLPCEFFVPGQLLRGETS